MFKKFSNSLLSPKEVAKYYDESFGKTILYILILVFFIMIPVVLTLSTSDILNKNMENQIQKAFTNEEIPFIIEDGTLKNVNNDANYVYTNSSIASVKIIIAENIENAVAPLDGIAIVLTKDGVYQKVAFITVANQIITYNDFDYLKNLDLSNPNIYSELSFWDNIFSIVGAILNEAKPLYVIVNSIYNLFYWVGMIVFFVLIISFFAKMRIRSYLSFWSLFKISFYSMTPFIICLVFSILFNITILIYIGYLISAIYNVITINEVLKRVYLTRNEGE